MCERRRLHFSCLLVDVMSSWLAFVFFCGLCGLEFLCIPLLSVFFSSACSHPQVGRCVCSNVFLLVASYSSSVPAFPPSLSPLLPRCVFRAADTTYVLSCISASPLWGSPSLHSRVDFLASQEVVGYKCGCARARVDFSF